MEEGNAVLLAWAEDYAPVKPMRQFKPRRSDRNTLAGGDVRAAAKPGVEF